MEAVSQSKTYLNSFVEDRIKADCKSFVSLNALIFNQLFDREACMVAVRVSGKDIPLTSFPFVEKKVQTLGIGEILADTNWQAEAI